MPRVREPESDEGRLKLLLKALETANIDGPAGRHYLPEEMAVSIGAFTINGTSSETGGTMPGYKPSVQTLTAKRAATSKEVEDADKADAVLETYIRDFWETLKRRTFRLEHSVTVLNHFELPQDGSIPVLASRADRYAWAEKIRDGEAAAVAAGFPAMSNPSAVEVAAKLTTAQQEAAQITPKSREEEDALNVVRALRPAAIALVEDILAELRHSTRKLEPGTARNVMRSYGVEFETLPGEEPDPQQPPQNPPTGGGTPPA